jgi:penicillin-binding protein 2
VVIPGDLPKAAQEKEDIFNQIFSFLESRLTKEEIDIAKQNLTKISSSSYQEYVIKENLDYETALELKIKLIILPGFDLKIQAQREYLFAEDFSHFLGYVGKIDPEELDKYSSYLISDSIGKTGLESFYENYLKGNDGQKRVEVNSLGKEESVVSEQSPQTGSDLILSIDSDLQKKSNELLKKYLKISHSQAGSIIALDPRNGEVLVLASLPTYDNNLFIQGNAVNYLKETSSPLVFRAISGEYPSGSVIKPVYAAAGLAEGIINEKTSFFSQGGLKIGQWFFADWKQGGHGQTNIIKALAESVNTFFYYLGGGYGDFKGLGLEKIGYYAKLFGLGNKTGLDLAGESDGFVPTAEWKQEAKGEQWYIGDTYHLSIGQGDLLVTPLQVANYTAAIANGGILFQPRLVKAFGNSDTKTSVETAPKIIRRDFIKSDYLNIVKKGIREAVVSGSAKRLNQLAIEVAGKTGTAQISDSKKSHAWFTSFAPYNQPEIVLTILIENGGEGSEIAVPLAEEFYKYYLSLKKL